MATDGRPPSWYRTRNGWALSLSYVALVLLGAVLSTGTVNLVDGVRTVPGQVYLFCAFGAILWGLAAIVRPGDGGPGSGTAGDADGDSTDDAGVADDAGAADDAADDAAGESGTVRKALFAGEARELVLRPFAALPLAAGVYLLSGVLAGSDAGPSTTATALLALFVGLYLHRTYDRLGRIADTLRRKDGDGSDQPSTPRSTPWYRRFRGALLVGAYLVAAVGALAATAEGSPLAGVVPEAVRIPPGVYLYGLLGVMGRIFTELVREEYVRTETLALRALRIPMGMLLAGAVSLVVALPSTSAPFGVAGLAFLVGLYEGVGFHYVALAGRRLLPTASEDASGGADRG